MSRLELIVILFVIVMYLWWRVRRRIEQVKASFRGERKQAKPAQHAERAEAGARPAHSGEGPGHRRLSPAEELIPASLDPSARRLKGTRRVLRGFFSAQDRRP